MALEQTQGLTPTEVVVADLAGRGRRTEEIASELGLESAAVADHLSQIYRKLGIGSRHELEDPTQPVERA